MTVPNKLPEKKDFSETCDEETQPEIPLSLQKRRVTDRWFKFLFISCFILLIPLLTYTLIYSDIKRYNGYDTCGNICGQKNVRYEQWNCTGQDMTLKPYAFTECETQETFDKRGHSSRFGRIDAPEFLKRFGWTLTLSYCIPIGFCLILSALFRYRTGFTILVIGIISWILLPTSAVLLLLNTVFEVSVPYAIVIVLLLCFMIPSKTKICLVIKLLRTASEAVFDRRSVIFIIILAWFLQFVIMGTYLILGFYINASGFLTETQYSGLMYMPDIFIKAAWYLYNIMTYWTILFVIGVGCITTSSAVAHRYFSMNREGFNSSLTSILYHLGTIALMTLLWTIMLLPRAVFMVLAHFSASRDLAFYCFRYLEGFFSCNVFIMTAMHGTSFIQSGKKAVKLSRSSVGNSESILSHGYFVIVLTQILIVAASTSIFSIVLTYLDWPFLMWDPIPLSLISFLSTEMILGPFKIAMSTIFFCICEGNMLRKEGNEPHQISMEEYLNDFNRFFAERIKERFPSRDIVHVERI